MDNRLIIARIKENLANRNKTDRIMWFSMWFLTSVATFGLAFFPMIYLLVDRRNKHFKRQKELEALLIAYFKNGKIAETRDCECGPIRRNPLLWSLSIILILPVFLIAYLLSKDLILHAKRQQEFFEGLIGEKSFKAPTINLKNCVLITVFTLGLGLIYWLYKIFNCYNYHFKEQWMMEDKIIALIK